MAINLLILIFLHLFNTITPAYSNKTFPAILIFGDSTVDTGNNNYIQTVFRANHLPYGRDFPGHVPTGRFSNGKLVPDFVASAIGLKELVPPFLQPNLSDNELITGVSFASAGSGLDDVTTLVSGVIPVSRQPHYFKDYKERLVTIVGNERGRRIIEGALVIVSAGTNDWVFNFFDLPTRRLQFTATLYQDFLLTKLHNLIKELYDLGMRNMVVSGLPPVGCLPIQLSLHSPLLRSCIQNENSIAQSYNAKLVKLLPQLQQMLNGSKIIYADVYTGFLDIIKNPKKYGFSETTKGCCGTGALETGPFCNEASPICDAPGTYLFWDSFHPSESFYRKFSDELVKELLPKT